MHRRESLEEFVYRACEDRPSDVGMLTLSIQTGCEHCGRRLLEAGDMVKPGTITLSVRDENTDETLAQYAVCGECVPART